MWGKGVELGLGKGERLEVGKIWEGFDGGIMTTNGKRMFKCGKKGVRVNDGN
jgi:hypothetical protein